MRSNSTFGSFGPKDKEMAQYRLIRAGRDKYRLLAIYQPGKGGMRRLNVTWAHKDNLAEVATAAATVVEGLRGGPKTILDGPSEPKKVVNP